MATSELFIGPLRETVGGAAAAEPRRRRRDRRARMERRHLGARRGGDDAARSLWRALGHDRPGARSRAQPRPREEETAMKRVGIGIIGCGNISAAYLKAAKKFPDPRHRRARRRSIPRPPRRARPSSACPRARSRRCSPTPQSRSSSISPSPRRMSRSASRRSRPASTSIPKSRSASPLAEASAADRGGEGEGFARRLRARHVSRRRAPDRAHIDRRGRDRPADRRHRFFHVPRP